MAQLSKRSWLTTGRALLFLAALLIAGCGSKEDRAQSYYDRGMKLLAQHDDVKAGIEFRNALQLKKDMVAAWRALAEIDERSKNWESLFGIRRNIVELDPNDVDAKLQLARLLFLTKSTDEALNLVNTAGELDKRNANVLGLKAMILYRRDDREAAVSAAQAALEIEPTNAEATAVLATDRLKRDDPEGALMVIDRESAALESSTGIQLLKIRILERMKNLEQVESVLRKLVERYPKEAAFRTALVKLYLYQNRSDDAEKELRSLAAANPTDVGAQMDVIRLLRTTKGPAAARQELEARIKKGGQVSEYQIALAEFEIGQGNVRDGVSLLENLGSGEAPRESALAAKIKLAEFYFGTKKFDEAETLVSQILREDSRNVSGLKLLAGIRIGRGQLDAAIADLRQALNDYPRSADLMLLLASAYERNGSIELADKQYADATKVSNFNASVGLNYAAFLQRRGTLERAEDILVELSRRSPNNLAVLSTLAQVRLARQEWIGAQEIADTIRRIGNDNGAADQIQAAVFSGQKKYSESINILEKAYVAAPDNVVRMVALVNELIRAQQFDKAETFVQTVLKKDRANAEAYLMLGSIQLLKNAPDQALKSFQAAVEQQPKNVDGYRALADFYAREKKNDEALMVIHAGLLQQPDSFTLRMALADILQSKGDYETAIAEYESLLKQQPGSMIIANNLASLLTDSRTDKASLERAYSVATVLRKSPLPIFQDTLGWIDYRRGDFKSAVSLLEEAATKRPDVGLLRYHLGMSYIAVAQPEKASEQLNKALELAPKGGELEGKIRTAQTKLFTK